MSSSGYTKTRSGRRVKKVNYTDPNTDESEEDEDQQETEEFVIKSPPKKRQKINAKIAKPIHDKIPPKMRRKRIRRKPKKSKSPSTTTTNNSISKTKSTKTISLPPLPTLSELEPMDEDDSDYDYKPKISKKRKKKKIKPKSKKKKRKKDELLNNKKNNDYSFNIKNKKKSQKKKRNKTTKTKICAHLNEDKIDIFIDGYFRKQNKGNTQRTVPIDVIRMINLYRSNIAYIIINFVWTHKYRCDCGTVSKCDILKRNRGCYRFKRESDNLYDSNAIAIYGDNGTKHVGYIDKCNAEILAPLIDSNVIQLKCIGGIMGKQCAECVEIIQLNKNQTLPSSLENVLESKHYESFKRVTSE